MRGMGRVGTQINLFEALADAMRMDWARPVKANRMWGGDSIPCGEVSRRIGG